MPWPPQVEDLKADLNVERADTRDDAELQTVLDAAVALVERERVGDLNFAGATSGADALLPAPGADVVKGTLRLAVRWWNRRRSPDGLIDSGGEFGSSRVPRFDSDIERMLAIGPYRIPMV